MHHIGVVKATHHMQNGVHLANVAEKFIAQALAFAGAAHQARDIDNANGGWNYFLTLNFLGDDGQTIIRNIHHANVGLNGAEWIVGGFNSGRGERVEEGALANIW